MIAVPALLVASLVALQAPQAGKPAAPVPERAPERTPPSLDEALGIGGKAPAPKGDAADPDLARSLDGEKPRDILASAIEDMRRSARLLEESDAGLDTRRAQESVVRKLDELIASAQRMKNQDQQQGSQKQQQRERSGQPQGASREQQGTPDEPREAGQPRGGEDRTRQERGRRRSDGDATANEPPAAVDPADMDAQLDEGRAEWGRLPPRVREAVRQGLRDPMSAAYRRLTQDYYRRLAEDPRR